MTSAFTRLLGRLGSHAAGRWPRGRVWAHGHGGHMPGPGGGHVPGSGPGPGLHGHAGGWFGVGPWEATLLVVVAVALLVGVLLAAAALSAAGTPGRARERGPGDGRTAPAGGGRPDGSERES